MSPALTFDELRVLCTDGQRIAAGPLNDAYVVTHQGRRRFVRHRHLMDDEYGQTFAAERYISPIPGVRVPRLELVVPDDHGSERFAVFEYIDGRRAASRRSESLRDLADALARVHEITAPGLGNVNAPLVQEPAEVHLFSLLSAEMNRLSPPDRARLGRDTRKRLAHALGCFEGERTCLCHGDVHADNLRIDHMGQLWLLDWEAARYRVAAADFNQIRFRWMTPAQDTELLAQYAALTGRGLRTLRSQVRILRVLWHIRTFNFHTLARGRSRRLYVSHLVAAKRLISACGGAADGA